MTDLTLKPGLYRHFKGGLYEVIDVALHSETEEPLVVYRSAGNPQLWARPLAMFTECVVHEGREMPRFAWLGPHPPTAASSDA